MLSPSAGSFTYVQDDKNLWVNCYIISKAKALSAAELGAGDGGGDGHVERLGGGATLRIVGDEELVAHQFLDLLAYAIALVAHDDDAM